VLLHSAYDIVMRDFGLSAAALAVGFAARDMSRAAFGSIDLSSSVSGSAGAVADTESRTIALAGYM